MRLETRKQKQKRARRAKTRAVVAMISTIGVIAVFAVILISGKIRMDNKSKEYSAKRAALEEQIEVQKERTERLNEKKEYTKTKEYIEDVAKNKLGLIYPDEIIFRAEDGGIVV